MRQRFEREPVSVVAACERVAGGKRHHHRFFDQRQHPDPCGLADGGADEGDVDAAGLQRPDQPGRTVLLKCDLHLRIGAPERPDRLRRQRMKAGRGRQPDPDFALLAARHPNDGIDGPLDARKYRCRLVAQGDARFRQFDAARLAPEQLRAKRSFEQLDLLAQRGLLNAEPRRGPGDVQFLGDDEKVAEEAEVHRHTISRLYGLVLFHILDMQSKDCYRHGMNHRPDALVLDFVEWVAASPRRYSDVMDAWKTSCPRLTIWEDAIDQGLVQRCRIDGELSIEATEAGRDLLAKTRRKLQRTGDGQDAPHAL